ncbi:MULTISPECIES: GTP-binding protein [unclassified Shewanella]|uniref:CobW family GTP-binding protein n=1 Tax=unclassified Shewanella TaxID=196818 RepID=UPI001BC82182|nr:MULTISPECIES: GTP-binding protein [unclassified Shewanella]GIU13352.1 cobalamin biosynthesis protein CobW [Shewanella sp. MBTL60-112-B1]GIU27360.1 cobalamin biosynthesis protein CobW [Shewanella sp. MBTL60-112-B2]
MIQKIIPTNVITGFLGVGKTSLIKALLQHKPEGEVWAVLVNEFGEIGIDAGLLDSDSEQIQIKEVAGGCMCCAAGVPMQVAINQLIAKAKPDRLLIEPTGLGHPKEVLKVLTQPHYRQVLAMKACVTLVDARKLNDSRYTEHEIFNQQLQVADVVLASKADSYPASLITELAKYLDLITPTGTTLQSTDTDTDTDTDTVPIMPWSLKLAAELSVSIMSLLERPHKGSTLTNAISSENKPTILRPSSPSVKAPRLIDINYSPLFSEPAAELSSGQHIEFDERGLLRKTNQGDGFYSCGWVFDPSYEFDFDKLLGFIKSLHVPRLKAVMITEEGIAGFNCVESELSIVELDDAMDSRIEILSMSEIDIESVEVALLGLSSRLGL